MPMRLLEKRPELGDDLEVILADLDKIPADIRQAVINNGGGALNHSLFWEFLSPEKQEPTADVLAAIEEAFGSFDEFKAVFTKAATTRYYRFRVGHGLSLTKMTNSK